MKRIVIQDEALLQVQRLDEDCFRIMNQEVDLILNYDAVFELALNLSRALQDASDETSEATRTSH
jgi:hypothetical protein